MPRELESIAEDLKNKRSVEPVTVRTFLSWFDAQRRGVNVVAFIRGALKEIGIRTEPDFESVWIDGPIELKLDINIDPDHIESDSSFSDAGSAEITSDETEIFSWTGRDPTYRISKLKAANVAVFRVSPTDEVRRAVTIMLTNGFSQLPVMTTDYEVKGVISWRSIGSQVAFGKSLGLVKDFMETAHEVSSEISIFDAIPSIVNYGLVLVRAPDRRISGIVTPSDLSLQFQSLTEPFLLLSEIENFLRNLIGVKFSVADLQILKKTGVREGDIQSVADLNFGEYIILLQEEGRWAKIGWPIDRKIFCQRLDEVRSIRNNVMHFDPDGLTEPELDTLRSTALFMKNFEQLLSDR